MTTTLERVRAAVIKAVPEILSDCVICGDGGVEPKCIMVGPHVVEARDITLADVLRTLEAGERTGFAVYQGGQIWLGGRYTMFRWNLALPLHLQSEEVLTFLDKTLNHD